MLYSTLVQVKYILLAFVLFVSCKSQTYVADIDTSYNRMAHYVDEDSEVIAIITPYKQALDSEMKTVIGHTPIPLTKGKPESTLGSWFCNIIREEASLIYGREIDFAIQNYGGLRIGEVSAGAVTVGKIYELMPFDNKLIVMKVNGTEVYQMAQAMASKGGWPISDNIKIYGTSDGKVSKVYIRNTLVHADSLYHVALPDYVANGGDDMKFLREHSRIAKDTFIRDVVINHLAIKEGEEKVLKIDTTKRFYLNQ